MKSKTIKSLTANSNAFSGIKGLTAVYLYGSAISGRLRKDSDIDIGILPFHNTTTDERLELISKVEGVVTGILKKNNLQKDVSVLDLRGKYVSLALLYKTITEGMLLYENNKGERLEFENALKGEYFDFVPFLESLRKKRYGDIFQEV
ncbi:MAG: nucleotidyltransferase domain-containing protein [Thermodesulfovibrionia bacterium]|nr:nucleotidyltransferase domain-containing protein [Thermodesulfovibrionia bacterium]